MKADPEEVLGRLDRRAEQTLTIALAARERGNAKLEEMTLSASSSEQSRLRRLGVVEGVTYGVQPPRLTELGVEVAQLLKVRRLFG